MPEGWRTGGIKWILSRSLIPFWPSGLSLVSFGGQEITGVAWIHTRTRVSTKEYSFIVDGRIANLHC